MTNPVFDPQQSADTTVQQQDIAPAGPQFDVYTPSAFAPPLQQQPVAPAPVPPKPKKTGIVVLSLFVVLLAGAGAAFGVLFFQEKGRSAELSTQVEGKDREIADLTKKAENSAEDTDRAVAAQKKAEADAVSSQKCKDAAKEIKSALVANDATKGEAAIKGLLVEC
ncbi:hypothetical protein [Lentzea californiensis]|uniref:hypothetical protein n=1 Tax=Lentzea californiensis TaxID=438851 RepID=UPI0021647D12|nr:hypothetical protein [Lentzea californiensis]MCR3748713.1 hypothetical protein [Lentzea californiensis]